MENQGIVGCSGCATTGGRMVCPTHRDRAWVGKMPFACPPCSGTGKVSRPPYLAGDQLTWSGGTNTIDVYPCNACKGTGIIWG
jgi:hypothetical protein